MLPESGLIKPLIIFIRVDFPLPLAPARAVRLFSERYNEAELRISLSPNANDTDSSCNVGTSNLLNILQSLCIVPIIIRFDFQ